MTRKNNTSQAMPRVITGEELVKSAKKEVPALKNKALQRHVDAIVKIASTESKGQWKVAEHIHDILASECYKEDFETQDELAKYLTMSKSQFTICKKAIEYRKSHGEVETLAYTVKRAYLASSIPDEDRKAFLEFCTANALPVSSDNDFSKALSAFKKDAKGLPWKSEEVAKAKKEQAEKEEGTAEEVTKDGKDLYVRITWREAVYELPVKALKAYKVEK